MRKLSSDPWLQAFAALAVIAGGILLYERTPWRAAADAVETKAAAVAAAPSQAAERLVADAMGSAQAAAAANASPLAAAPAAPAAAPAAPAAAAPSAPAPQPKLTVTPPPAQGGFAGIPAMTAPAGRHLGRPKKSGQWVVDQAGGAGSDTTSLRDAVFSAVSGDEILLRPGDYADGLDLGGKDLILRGSGARRDEVRIVLTDQPTLLVSGGTTRLENLSVIKRPSPSGADINGAALSVAAGTARLKGVELEVEGLPGAALRAADGAKVYVNGGALKGTHADAMLRGRAHAEFKGTAFVHDINPVVAWNGARAVLRDCRLRLDARGALRAYEGGSVTGADAPVSAKRSPEERSADSRAYGTPPAVALQTAGGASANDPNSALYQIIPMIQSGAQGAQGAGGPTGQTGSRFRKDIFRPGRKPGDINQ